MKAIKIKHDGSTWRVLSRGTQREGKTYCHLESTTMGTWQRNGYYPAQIADWIDDSVLLEAEQK